MAGQFQSAQPPLRDSGQILVLTTVSMIALMGIMAFTLDASFMFEKRNRLHAAADAAAKSAAIEVDRNPSVALTSLQNFADEQVSAHGFVSTRLGGTTSVVVNHPPTTGDFAGNAAYVQVIASEGTSTFFAKITGWMNMTPTASAIAGAGNPTTCMIIQEDLSIGNTFLNLNGCGVEVGGNLYGNNPNSTIGGTPTPPVGVTGTCSGTCGAMGSLTTGVPPPDDPFAGLAAPSMPTSPCVLGTAATLSPGCYTGMADTVTTLSAGEYYVTGPIEIGNLSGTGVLIYLTGSGQLTAQNNRAIHLTAPTTGTYAGIAIFQDVSDTLNFEVGQNFTIDVTGAIYMPGTDVNFQNSLMFTTTGCTLFIAKSLFIRNGNGLVSNSGCASTFGTAGFLVASIAR
jgi:Flp pilus assembly protein TadG